MKKVFNLFKSSSNDLLSSKLYNDKSFYDQFIRDLRHCKKEVIIESPFLTLRRAEQLAPTFVKLVKKGVKIVVTTRYPKDHTNNLHVQADATIPYLARLGIEVRLLPDLPHRKIAILDKKILWEGSLNILSHNSSSEIMRRIESGRLSRQMLGFIKHNAVF